MAIYKAGNQIGKVYKGSNQIGKVYKGSTLIYQAQSDTYTVTATATSDAVIVKSNTIKNTDNYTKMVIESVSASGGNYGENWARLYVNGVKVKDTGGKGDGGQYVTAVQSWRGNFNISQNGIVYVEVYSDRDENRDDAQNPTTATVEFHFE